MEAITQKYLPSLNKTLKRYFPEYFKKIKGLSTEERKSVPIITQAEINILHNKYKNEGDIKARDKLIYSQLRLVYYYSYQYFMNENKTRLDMEDLLGFANQILVEIIEEYDPYKKREEDGEFNKLPSFIRTWLYYNLHKKQKDYGLAIQLPHNQINDTTLQVRYESTFQRRFGREPFNGESIEVNEYGFNNRGKSKSQKKVTFNYDEKHLLLETNKSGKWVFDRIVKIPKNKKVISGNIKTNDSREEIFDTMRGDHDVPLGDDNNLLILQITEAITNLTERERESVDYLFYRDEPLNNIPALLTPDYTSKKEVNSLNQTSSNTVDIYLKKDGKQIHLQYDITVNNHVKKTQELLQENPLVNMLTHKYKKITTTLAYDSYKFEIEGATDIKIIHGTCDNDKNIDFTYDGRILNFSVNYSFGVIFATQTFINKKEKLMNKLRKELRYLKNSY